MDVQRPLAESERVVSAGVLVGSLILTTGLFDVFAFMGITFLI